MEYKAKDFGAPFEEGGLITSGLWGRKSILQIDGLFKGNGPCQNNQQIGNG